MSLSYSANNTAFTGPQTMFELKKLLAGTGSSTSQGTAGGQGWLVAGSSDGTSFSHMTSIAAASNSVALPTATISVASTTGFAASGTFQVIIGQTVTTVTYTGTTATTFTGCTGGTGTLLTGQTVNDSLNDRWSATPTANGAWAVLQMPLANGVYRHILIQRGSTNTSWRIGYSYSAGFNGALNNAIGAGLLAAPTATDGQALAGTFFGASANATPTYSTSFFTTDATYNASCAADSASPYGFWMWTASGTATTTGLVFDPLITGTYPSADTDPYCIFAGASAGNGFQGSVDMGGGTVISSSNIQAWLKKGLAGEGFVRIGTAIFFLNGAAIQNKVATVLGPNAADGNDVLLPIYYGRVASLASPTGGKGMSSMMQWVVNSRALKDTVSVASAGAKDYIVINDIAFMWNGSVPA